MAIRRERPTVSAALILRTLVLEGRLPEGAISAATLRRLYRAEGLDRQSLQAQDRDPRRRWQADAPGVLWHADVCHGPALRIEGRSVPLRIHAILDDYSRYVVAIQACTTERESEMLALMVKALRAEGAPSVLYLDNGSTYSGHALATACTRLGIALVHAKPYDAPARGKMERLWRTMREQCLDHCAGLGSLHGVQARLLAWLDAHYHATGHAGLMGKCPALAYEECQTKPVPEAMLAEALTVRGTRRIRRDGTVSVAGTDFAPRGSPKSPICALAEARRRRRTHRPERGGVCRPCDKTVRDLWPSAPTTLVWYRTSRRRAVLTSTDLPRP